MCAQANPDTHVNNNKKKPKTSTPKIKCSPKPLVLFEIMVNVVFQNVFFRKYIKIIFFLIFKNLFLISAHQNDKKKIKAKNFIYF
jgi:hypothetical protein